MVGARPVCVTFHCSTRRRNVALSYVRRMPTVLPIRWLSNVTYPPTWHSGKQNRKTVSSGSATAAPTT